MELYKFILHRVSHEEGRELLQAIETVDRSLEEEYGGQDGLMKRETDVKAEISAGWIMGSKVTHLTRGTHFTQKELLLIKDRYIELTESGNGSASGLSLEQLTKILERLPLSPPADFAYRVFKVYDTDESGTIDLKQLVCCLSCIWKGNLHDRLRLCFEIFDKDESGFLSLDEVKSMADALLQMLPPSKEQGRVRSKSHVYDMLSAMDVNGDKMISFDEFHAYVLNSNELLQAFGFGVPHTNTGHENEHEVSVNKAMVVSYTTAGLEESTSVRQMLGGDTEKMRRRTKRIGRDDGACEACTACAIS